MKSPLILLLTSLLTANRRDTILVTVDKATRMVHLAPCRRNITATGTAQLLWNTIIRYHGIPRVIYSDRGAQFTVKSMLGRNCGEFKNDSTGTKNSGI